MKPYYQDDHATITTNRIYTANCAEFMSERMQPETVDLTVTSPPYDDMRDYQGYSFPFEDIAKGLYRITKDGGVVVWVVGDKIKGGRSLTSFRQALYFQELGFQCHDVMIYEKKNTPFMRKNAYTNAFEFMFILTKGKPKTFNPLVTVTQQSGFRRNGALYNKGADGVNRKRDIVYNEKKTRTNIWRYSVGLHGTTSDKFAFKHPAMFPEKLAEDHILSWSNAGDLVFDPMNGSGTTCKMAQKHQRKYIGVDISPEYCEIAARRLAQEVLPL